MKCAIQTIVDYNNYGNRLQNYAMQEILRELSIETITIKNNIPNPYMSYPTNNFDKLKKILINREIHTKFDEKIKHRKINLLRKKNFLDFSKKYINETNQTFYEIPLDDSDFREIDFFIIGSDQVWNYIFGRFSFFDFLPFTNKPKISYAASFGVNKIPKDLSKIYVEGLEKIDFISVREFAGKKIVEGLTDKKASVVLDPTLMLKKNKWLNLAIDKPNYKDKYILTYFLDRPQKKDEDYIYQYAKKNALNVKKLGDARDKELWVADPAEFVNLFSQADAIFTDSFHACVFSIIFEKYFEIFERNTSLKSMNSRIDTLFNMLDLDDRWHNNNNNGTINEIDYKKVKDILAVKRAESQLFLTNSIAALSNMKG